MRKLNFKIQIPFFEDYQMLKHIMMLLFSIDWLKCILLSTYLFALS